MNRHRLLDSVMNSFRYSLVTSGLIFSLLGSGCIEDSSIPRPEDNELGDTPDVMILEETDGMSEPAGDMAGEIAGEQAGETAGEIAGEQAGEIAGASAGAPAGASAGEPSGESAGEEAGEVAGEGTGGQAGTDLMPDDDEDNDGISNRDDNCPLVANNSQRDRDDDGVGDRCDNCPEDANFDQADEDSDGVGDACTARIDSDGDQVVDLEDNCINIPNPRQGDQDDDGRGNACDNCPNVPNNDQADADSDGVGDLCDEVNTPITIELSWDDQTVDFDLHMINPRGQFFSQTDDCWARNRAPAWAAPGLSEDAPQNGETREVISMDTPGAGWHVIGIDLYTRRNATTGTASLTLSCRGEVTQLGPREFTSDDNRSRSLWEVIRFNPSTCEVEQIDEVRSVSCSGNQASSCSCEECQIGPCSACPVGATCDGVTGVCDDRCAGVECESGSLCNQATGICESAQCAPCSGESDCPDGSYCVRYVNQEISACGVTCEEDSDCASDNCTRIFRDNRAVFVCADNNACQDRFCDMVTCDTGTVCDPTDGECVSCYTNDQCGEGLVCVDRACVEPTGGNRDVSSWGDGNQPPSCEQCIEGEECIDYPLVPDFCALPCNDALLCPEGFSCCRLGGRFGLPESQICVDDRNDLSGQVCR